MHLFSWRRLDCDQRHDRRTEPKSPCIADVGIFVDIAGVS